MSSLLPSLTRSSITMGSRLRRRLAVERDMQRAFASSSDTTAAARTSNPPPDADGIVWTTHRLNAEQISKVDAIFHKTLWLDMIETALLTEAINLKLGRFLTQAQRDAIEKQIYSLDHGDADAADETTAEVEDEGPKVVELKLVGFDAKAKIKVIKEVRAIAGLGLKESKELVEGAPSVVQKDLKPEQAEEFKEKLEAIGAQVEIV